MNDQHEKKRRNTYTYIPKEKEKNRSKANAEEKKETILPVSFCRHLAKNEI